MPSERLFGAVLSRAAGPRYWESLRFAEIAPREPLPRPSTLKKWRNSAPEQARLAFRPPPGAWLRALGVPLDCGGKEAMNWMRDAADALGADALVLETGRHLTPGPRDRERLARLVARLEGSVHRPIVWVPGGLWDSEDAAQLAASIGAICGFDPLEGPAPSGALAYGRVRAIGARARLGEGLLRAIVDVSAESSAASTWIALESEDGMRKARRASEMLAAIDEGGAPSPRTRMADLADEDSDAFDDDADEDGDAFDDEEPDEDGC
jgi:hypothetical protein